MAKKPGRSRVKKEPKRLTKKLPKNTRKLPKKPVKRPTRKLPKKPVKRPTRKLPKKPVKRPTRKLPKKPVKRPTRKLPKKPAPKPAKRPTRKLPKKPVKLPTKKLPNKPVKRPTRKLAPRPAAPRPPVKKVSKKRGNIVKRIEAPPVRVRPPTPRGVDAERMLKRMLAEAGMANNALKRQRSKREHTEGSYTSGWRVVIPVWRFLSKQTLGVMRKLVNAWRAPVRGPYWLVNAFASVFSESTLAGRSYATAGNMAPPNPQTDPFRRFFQAQEIFASGKRTSKRLAIAAMELALYGEEAAKSTVFIQHLIVSNYRDKTEEEQATYRQKLSRRRASNVKKATRREQRTNRTTVT